MKFEYFCSFIYVIMYLILLYICIQKLLNLPAILLSAILAIAFWDWPLPSAIRDLTNYASSSHWVLHAITVVGGNVCSKLQLAFKCFCMLCVFMPRNAYHHASNPAEFLLILHVLCIHDSNSIPIVLIHFIHWTLCPMIAIF